MQTRNLLTTIFSSYFGWDESIIEKHFSSSTKIILKLMKLLEAVWTSQPAKWRISQIYFDILSFYIIYLNFDQWLLFITINIYYRIFYFQLIFGYIKIFFHSNQSSIGWLILYLYFLLHYLINKNIKLNLLFSIRKMFLQCILAKSSIKWIES